MSPSLARTTGVDKLIAAVAADLTCNIEWIPIYLVLSSSEGTTVPLVCTSRSQAVLDLLYADRRAACGMPAIGGSAPAAADYVMQPNPASLRP